MRDTKRRAALVLVWACATGGVLWSMAGAQAKIVCWKDKSGKVVGCGDSVPPEYRDNASTELDQQGIPRKATDSVEDLARRRPHDEELAREKAEREQRAAKQRREDSALLNTFASGREIDAKRDREMQVIDLQITQLRVSLRNAADRYADAQARQRATGKTKAGVSQALQDEVAHAADEKKVVEDHIAAKGREKEAIRARYAEYRKRFAELRGTAAPAPAKK